MSRKDVIGAIADFGLRCRFQQATGDDIAKCISALDALIAETRAEARAKAFEEAAKVCQDTLHKNGSLLWSGAMRCAEDIQELAAKDKP